MLRLSLVCAAAVVVLSACGGGTRAAGCTIDSDCPSPETCTAHQCVNSGCGVGSSTCAADTDCGLGQHCANGCCAVGITGSCTKNADCSAHPVTPFCDTTKGTCVQCVIASDCGLGKVCQSGVCANPTGCSANTDCHDKSAPVCDTNQHACVQCLAAKDCTNLSLPVCNAQHTCVSSAGCEGDPDCHDPLVPKCQVSSGQCVGCLTTADCKNGNVCTASNTCQAPSASGCTQSKDCASNSTNKYCKPGTGGAPGTCVACLADGNCPAGDTCVQSSNTCAVKQCASDGACVKPAPRCDLVDTPHVCVACLGPADCPNGGTCQSDHTCKAASGACTADAQCASSLVGPYCDTKSGKCVACNGPGQCPVGKVCGPQETCVANTCTGDGDCTSLPSTPHCSGSAANPGTCVQCATSAQCPAGFHCPANSCVPVCTRATEAQDCTAPLSLCKEAAAGNHCVQCLADTDCTNGQICDQSDSACKAPVASGCSSSAACAPPQPVCDTAVSPHACVQCLADTDCSNKMGCDQAAHTCTVTGGLNEACNPDSSCGAGLLCVTDATGNNPVCLQQCDPYASGSGCSASGAGFLCEWLGFDSTNTFTGICAAPNTHGKPGAACNPALIDSCEWNLLCAQTSPTGGTCTSFCNPSGGSCASGVCNTIVGAEASDNTLLKIGYCGAASKWQTACTTDTPSSGVPQCGSALSTAGKGGLFCAPSSLLAENPQQSVLALCSYGPLASTATGGATASGGANTSCAAHSGDDCRTGVCLSDGTDTCFASCQFTADCARDDGGNPAVFCFDVNYVVQGAQKSNALATCEPTCRDDADCAVLPGGFARTCAASRTHNNTSWQSVCGPAQGPALAGAHCTTNSDCASGSCFTGKLLESIELGQPVTSTATDGFCLGACYQASDCATAGTECNLYTALPLTTPAQGGVMGWPNPGVCWGKSGCTRDADCAGFSADTATPRVCAPYKFTDWNRTDTLSCNPSGDGSDCAAYLGICNAPSNNPNPGGAFGANAGINGPNGLCRETLWDVQCAPSLGASLGGAGKTCAKDTDCRTGHCVDTGSAKVCFGACKTNTDCATGTHCLSGSYLGLVQNYCQ